MKVGVVTFPGSLDDADAQRAVRIGGHEAVALWHGDHDLRGVDAVVLPGGFSYGDYLRCGAIARFSPVMTEVIEAAGRGMPVLGICNGFQILCESHLLPGALIRNDHQQVRLPRPAAAHRERLAPRGPRPTPRARRSRSCSRTARAASSPTPRPSTGSRARARSSPATSTCNPNGSLRDIAGITNAAGNVVGLMPHPEHAVEDLTGCRHRRPRLLHLAGRGRPSRDARGVLFRRVAVAEAVTWALLLVGMFLKYVTETTDLAVRVFGMLHGVVFVAYCLTVVLVAIDQRWSAGPHAPRAARLDPAVLHRALRRARRAPRRLRRHLAARRTRPRRTTAASTAPSPGCCATRCAARWSASPRSRCSPPSRSSSARPPAAERAEPASAADCRVPVSAGLPASGARRRRR